MRRFLWLLMVLLLVGSFVGAWAAHHSPGGVDKSPRSTEEEGKDFIVAQGYVDVEKGIIDLYPRQPGLVVKLAAENQAVKAGDLLLQVDDQLAQKQLAAAEYDLNAAQALLDKAELQLKLYPPRLEEQKAAAEVAKSQAELVESETESKLKVYEESKTDVAKTTRAAIAAARGKAQNLRHVEEAKLKELEISEAGLKIDIRQATNNRDAKKAEVEKAREALELYKVKAPADGIVLRILTQEGATLGTSPKQPALQFRPAGPLYVKAEVLQEWGRLVREKQHVVIVDDIYGGDKWDGEVQTVAQWYAPTRTPVIEPLKMNDVRTLDCLIKVKGDETGLRIGQRMRCRILLKEPAGSARE